MLASENYQAVADAIKGFEHIREVCKQLGNRVHRHTYCDDLASIGNFVKDLRRAGTEAMHDFDRFIESYEREAASRK